MSGMSPDDQAFQRRLLATFRLEADEHLQAMDALLTTLAAGPEAAQQSELIETIYREAHSLKGAARAVDQAEIETVCQSLESVFAALKRGSLAFTPALAAQLTQALDAVGALVAALAGEPATPQARQVSGLAQQLDALVPDTQRSAPTPRPAPATQSVPASPAPAPAAPEPPAASAPLPERATAEERPAATTAETIRISVARLDALLLQAEELVAAKLAAEQRANELREAGAALTAWSRQWAKLAPRLRVQAGPTNGGNSAAHTGNGHDPVAGLAEFLEAGELLIRDLSGKLTTAAHDADRDQRALSSMVDRLLDDMKTALLLPIGTVLEGFPRLVREVARDRGKEVDLILRGAEVELDRRILQEIKDPLVHLMRNGIDHGLETPEVRLARGKPARGTLTLAAAHQDGRVIEISVADDGAGIDGAAVRAAAVRQGLLTPEAAGALSEAETQALIFQSGFSTSTLITDLSGRGLGLAIVKEKVEKLGGVIAVESAPGVGTTFRLRLPLTTVTIRGLLVGAGAQRYVLPTAHVERVGRIGAADVQTVENRATIQFEGRTLPLVSLAATLGLPVEPAPAAGELAPVVILGAVERRLAFRIGAVLGEQEVLVKTLGPQLPRVRHIAGATVLGTGQVVPILSVPDLLKSAISGAAGAAPVIAAAPAAPAKVHSLLVVEDSITARTLLKSILETAGYHVTTAVDGLDALATLRTGEYDLVVSDVEMPRLNGLDLTAKIRADPQLKELPVVLVTALESREDRERGIEVGANAYLVKQSFDQSNLLAVVRRLL